MAIGGAPASERNTGTPWMRRKEWAAGKIIFSAGKFAAQAVVVVVVVDLASIAALLIICHQVFGRGNWWSLLGLALPAIGLRLTFLAIADVRRWQAFGSSVFEMASLPGVIGGQLVGVVRTSVKVQPEDGFHLTLNCVRSVGDSTDRIPVWQDEQIIAGDLLQKDPQRSAIPVLFQIPYDCPPTDEASEWDRTCWQLKVSAKTSGPKYRVTFDVPVFKTPKSDPCFVVDRGLIAGYASPGMPDSDLREAGILKMVSPAGEGCQLLFPMARIPTLAIVIALMGLLFGGIPFWVCYTAPPEFWFSKVASVVIFGGFGLLLLGASADLWFFRSTVDVSSRGLKVTAGWLGLSRLQRIEESEIERIEAEISAIAWGEVVYYNIVAVCRDRKVTLGKRVPGRRLAEAVCCQIASARAKR